MTDKQAIEFLKKKIEKLERELDEERVKSPYIPYIPRVPYEPYKPYDLYWREGTYTSGDTGDIVVKYPLTYCEPGNRMFAGVPESKITLTASKMNNYMS